MRTTHTYATTNIVIIDAVIYAEDFSYDASKDVVHARIARFINPNHARSFISGPDHGEHMSAMRLLTEWLHEVGAVVDKWWNLPETLTDEERDEP